MRRFLLLTVLLLAGCGSNDGGEEDSAAGGEAVQITATDFALDPTEVSVDAAGATTFTLENAGQTAHALEIGGDGVEEATDTVAPGESTSVTVDLEPGEYELYCPIAGHREQGMEATLVVGAGSSGAGTSTGKTETQPDYGYGG